MAKKPTKRKTAGVKTTGSVSPVGDAALDPLTKATLTSEPVSSKKIRYELLSYDEYGQGNIVLASNDLTKIQEAAKRIVTEQNVDNALTASDRDASWEGHYPVIFENGKESSTVLYAGDRKMGKPNVYVKTGDTWELKPADGYEFRFFLGNVVKGKTKEPWYLKDVKGNPITTLKNGALERKNVLFVKVI